MAAAIVLLRGLHSPLSWAPVTAGLNELSVLMPQFGVPGPSDQPDPAAPFTMTRGATEVLATLDRERVSSAVVCGVGLGALVALTLAVEHPDRVRHLVLVTRQVRLSPILMSLPAAILRLLPASAVQRLGAKQPQLLALLDQVRPVDAIPLARQVRVPATVLCGARDPLNRRPSQSLAAALPSGHLQLIDQAGPRWPTDSPDLLATALRRVLREEK